MRYDIFISYRREGSYDTAKHLNDMMVRVMYGLSLAVTEEVCCKTIQ